MCGRYSLIHGASEIAARFDVEEMPGWSPRYNAAPTDSMPVVVWEGGRHVRRLRWGLVPFWAEDLKVGARMINARSETAAKKPAFRAAFRRRRCLVVADGFYEWVSRDGKKWPIRVTFGEGELFAMAGLWERWSPEGGDQVETFTILTTDAQGVMEEVHHRMPVWCDPRRWEDWLCCDGADAEGVLEEIQGDFDDSQVSLTPVSRRLNRPGVDEPELWEPVDEPGLPRVRPLK